MMVEIITDSICDLPSQLTEQPGITVIPLNILFGKEFYRDGIDLTTEEFYRRQSEGVVIPVTSAPTPSTFAEAYDRLAEATDEILVITISSELSATYKAAVVAIGLMKKRCRVEVVDSRWAISAEGLIVVTAAKAVRAGANLDEVVAVVQRSIRRVDMRATFDTLEYLKRGGRIGAASVLLGSVLNVNPIITIRNGIIHPAGRERSRAKAIDYLCNFAMSYSHIEEMAIEDATTPGDAEELAERLSAKFPKERIYRCKTSPVIGTNTGPHVLVLSLIGDR
ncbi:MAG: DegV family protein [Dehalococcoidales bacterium]|nr:DegV family protein [Dehalococcoidales bacterium]